MSAETDAPTCDLCGEPADQEFMAGGMAWTLCDGCELETRP